MASSNPTEEFTTPGVFAPKTFSEVWCVEITVMHPIRRKCSAMATASAAPSSGSVAEPSSSSKHQRVRCRSARDEVDVGDVGGERREILLDRLVVADVREHGIEHGNSARSAGTGMPDCAIRASRPTVFRVTVLPPVFGPVMTSSRRSPSSSMLMGTTCPPFAFRFRLQQRVARVDAESAGRMPRLGQPGRLSPRESARARSSCSVEHGTQL